MTQTSSKLEYVDEQGIVVAVIYFYQKDGLPEQQKHGSINYLPNRFGGEGAGVLISKFLKALDVLAKEINDSDEYPEFPGKRAFELARLDTSEEIPVL